MNMNDVKYPMQYMEGTPFNFRTLQFNNYNIPGPVNIPPRTTPLFQSELKRASRPPAMAPASKTLHENVKAILHKPWLNLKMARTVSADYQNDLVTAIFVANKLLPSFEEYSKQCDKELEQILNKRSTASLKTKIEVRAKTLEELQDGIKPTAEPLPPPQKVICEVPRRRKRARVQTLGRVIGNLKRMHNALNPRIKSKLTRWNVEYCFVPMLKLPESERLKYIEELAESECDRVSLSSEFSPAPSMEQDEGAEVDKRIIPNEESSDASEMDKNVTEQFDNESICSSSKNSVAREETGADDGTSNKDHDSDKSGTDSNIIGNLIEENCTFNERSKITNDVESIGVEKMPPNVNKLQVDNGTHYFNNENSLTDLHRDDTIDQEESLVKSIDAVDRIENQNINGNVPSENGLCSSLESDSLIRKRRLSSSIEDSDTVDMTDLIASNNRRKKKKMSLERRSSGEGDRNSLSEISSDCEKRRPSISSDEGTVKSSDEKNGADFNISEESCKFKTSNDCDSYAASPISFDDMSGRKTPLKVESHDDEIEFFLPDISDLDISPRKDPIELEESHQNYLARANRATVPPILKTLHFP